MQVEVADVGAHVTGPAESDLGVHVGAVHVDLATVAVHNVTDFLNGLFEDAVSTGIGDHQRGELPAVLFGFGFEIGHVDVAIIVAADDDDFHAGHDGAGRVGAVGGRGDKTDVAMFLAAAVVQSSDHEQAGVLALGAGVGL